MGDFRKRWATARKAIGLEGGIVHDLPRSGVSTCSMPGSTPPTTMAFSGHRTASMLKRYYIIDLDDLRRAAVRAQDYRGTRGTVTRSDPTQPHFGHTRELRALKWRPVVELRAC